MVNNYPHIDKDLSHWPITKQSQDREGFIDRLNDFVVKQLLENHKDLYSLISKTIYLEKQRVKLSPWKVDPPDDKEYWNKITKDLEVSQSLEDKYEIQLNLLKKIVNRYNNEIVPKFKPGTFKFGRFFLTTFFSRIFNRYFEKGMFRWGNKSDLSKKIILKGPVEKIRELYKKGTLVMVPTHYSNLDSIMIGYAIDTNVGLPFFSYGAGLNLLNNEIVGYFIDRLGAFRVDRRKKNPIYLECLKSMTSYSVYEGLNCLFFPGGTRSRSGRTEDKLKLGLLGSAIEAQRIHIEGGSDKRVFLVPLCVGYHFVMEAPSLVDQHLRSLGNEQYSRSGSAKPTSSSLWKFFKQIYTKSSEVYMSFGEPLDILGNVVDIKGNSVDKFGNPIQIKDYFISENSIANDKQRDGVYAKNLAEVLVKSYKKYNVILSSNVVSFTAFHMINNEFKEEGYISLINKKNKTYDIACEEFFENVKKIVEFIKGMNKNGEVTLSNEPWEDIEVIIKMGIEKGGIYHSKPLLEINKNNVILCRDFSLLYFYHNRLCNYGLESLMGWHTVE